MISVEDYRDNSNNISDKIHITLPNVNSATKKTQLKPFSKHIEYYSTQTFLNEIRIICQRKIRFFYLKEKSDDKDAFTKVIAKTIIY